MESFFASLKTECVYQQQLKTREQTKALIFDYIAVFYNILCAGISRLFTRRQLTFKNCIT